MKKTLSLIIVLTMMLSLVSMLGLSVSAANGLEKTYEAANDGDVLYNEDFFTAVTTNVFIFTIAFIACFPIIPYIRKRLENSSSAVYSIGIITATVLAILLLFINTSGLVKTFSSNNPFLYWNF